WIAGSSLAMTKRSRPLPLRQLQLDAAVAFVGLFGVAGVERLKLGEAGGDQPLRRHAARDQVLHHRDRACRRQLPVRMESRPLTGRTSVWPSTRSTQGISGGIFFSISLSALATVSS